VRKARLAQQTTQTQLSQKSGVARATIQKFERGEPARDISPARIEAALGWVPGSSRDILNGQAESPIAVESLKDDVVAARIPDGEMEQAASSAVLAVADNMTAAEIREVSRRVVEELKARGLTWGERPRVPPVGSPGGPAWGPQHAPAPATAPDACTTKPPPARPEGQTGGTSAQLTRA
jgi:transcriptional regulator with XRE-family HTH domain